MPKKMPGITGHPRTTSTPDQGLFSNLTLIRQSVSTDRFRIYTLGDSESPQYVDGTIAADDVADYVLVTLRQVFSAVDGPRLDEVSFAALNRKLVSYVSAMVAVDIADVQISFKAGLGLAVIGFHRYTVESDSQHTSTRLLIIGPSGELVEFRKRPSAKQITDRRGAFGSDFHAL